MAASQAQLKATAKYKAKNYKRVPLDMQLSEYEELKETATASGQTVNGYIKAAIREKMEREQGSE